MSSLRCRIIAVKFLSKSHSLGDPVIRDGLCLNLEDFPIESIRCDLGLDRLEGAFCAPVKTARRQ